jgi:VWFA-related protein
MNILKMFCGLACLFLPLPLLAQEPAKTFRDTASVVVIEVPVNVVDDGKPVRGLTSANFRVFDGEKEQPLAGFEVIDLEVAASAMPAAVPAPARRRFLLFFDLAFTPRADLSRSLAAARELLSGLHPADVVALAAYTRGRGAELLLNFTTDRRQAEAVLGGVEAVLDGKTPRRSQSGGRDPLRLVVDQGIDLALDVTANDVAGEELADMVVGSRGSAGIAGTLADRSEVNVERNRDRARSYFRGMSEALADFAAATAGLDGRRFFVFFSRGFDGSIFDSGQSLSGPSGGGGTSARTSLTKAIEDFRRAGWEVHSVDPRRPDSERGDSLQAVDNLLSLAKDTGGSLYRYFGNLGTAMDEMLERSAVTYLLAFQIENVRQDGAFHPIKVELRGGPGGARVYHRSGYTAPDPAQAGIAKVVSTAEKLLSAEESADLPLRTLLMPLRAPGGMVRMAVLFETDGEALLADASGEELGVEAYAYAIDDKGDVADFLAQQVTLDVGKLGEEMLAGKSFDVFSDLSLPPGKYQLRVMLRQRQTGRQVLKTLPLEVPDLEADGPSLSALMMVAHKEPLLIREKAGANVVPYPFVVGEGQEFFPDVAPLLEGADTRRLTLFGYGLQEEGYKLSIQLEKAGGGKVEGNLKLVGAAPTEPDGLDRLYLLLDPAGLAPGAYRLLAVISFTDGKVVGKTVLDLAVGVP